ncbi:hypothetical protein Pcatena_03270 [Parolsenella catena]|uniref:Uncharacterized protein n=1 Tax=Parolsenella catena TaxID=2003188 RepID=A0A3G9K9K4_9ACTN|nr:hypothetical protein Pcatena_03270 [Parolsenella catena]
MSRSGTRTATSTAAPIAPTATLVRLSVIVLSDAMRPSLALHSHKSMTRTGQIWRAPRNAHGRPSRVGLPRVAKSAAPDPPPRHVDAALTPTRAHPTRVFDG